MVLDVATRALRENSPELLASGLEGFLLAESTPVADERDVMMGLAPLYDCAKRLGLDPVVLFDEAARDQPSGLGELLRRFARRDDVTPHAFGFVVQDGPSGPQYRWA